MTSLLRTAAVAAGVLWLSLAAAQAQSFEELTREGQQAFRAGDWARAIDARMRQLSMTPPKPQDRCFIYWGFYTAYTIGTGEMDKGLKAVDDSLQCLNAIPDNSQDMMEFRVEAMRYRAIVLRDLGRYDEALAVNDAQLRLQPQQAKQLDASRAINLDAKGDYEAAAAAFSRAAENARDAGFWRSQAAWMRVKQGRFDEALRLLADSDRINPRVAGKDGNTRAWIYAEQGKYDDAVADIKSDERSDPGNATTHAYLRGYIEAARGNFDEAAIVFKRAAAANSNNATVQVASYLAQARAGRVDTSTVSKLAASMNRSKWPDAQVFYVSGLIDRNEFEAAAKFGNPRIERVRLCRMSLVAGEVALLKGDKNTAKADFNRAAALCAFDPAAQERTWANGELAMIDAPPPVRAPIPAPVTAPPAVAPPAAAGTDPCAYAGVHWTSAESIGTRAAFEDHLKRFPACAFATLATARIAALGQPAPAPASTPAYTPPPTPSAALPPDCKPGYSRNSDGDCVREKAANRPAPRRSTSRAAPEGEGGGGGKGVLDCTTPAGLFACANRALSKSPIGNAQ